MNKAQKKTWLTFAISLVTLLVTAALLWYKRANGIAFANLENPIRTRLLLISQVLPLILILILPLRYPNKIYDERDLIVERNSAGVGYVAALIFLVAAGFFQFMIVKPTGEITNIYVWGRFCLLLYLSVFVSFLVSSLVSLIQYKMGVADTL